jgi:hypothetical protein
MRCCNTQQFVLLIRWNGEQKRRTVGAIRPESNQSPAGQGRSPREALGGLDHDSRVTTAAPLLPPRLKRLKQNLRELLPTACTEQHDGLARRGCIAHRPDSIASSVWISSLVIELTCELAW